MDADNLLFKDKQVGILLTLRDSTRDWSLAELARSTGTTYAHACNFIMACERTGIAVSEKHGKIKIIRLSEKGKRVADSLFEVKSILAQQSGAAQQKPAAASVQQPQA
ncbi:MAG: hypothetical protein QXR58_00920 [Candidatus Micrarchaeaceae archaeon]